MKANPENGNLVLDGTENFKCSRCGEVLQIEPDFDLNILWILPDCKCMKQKGI